MHMDCTCVVIFWTTGLKLIRERTMWLQDFIPTLQQHT